MMEYFTYKKIKKHQAEKKARDGSKAPVLSKEDEHFLKRIVSAEGTPPQLPERPRGLGPEAGDYTENRSQLTVHEGRTSTNEHDQEHEHKNSNKGKGKENEKTAGRDSKKGNRFSFLQRIGTKKDRKLSPIPVVPLSEAEKEQDDINKILDDLNLAAVNNRAFSISAESQELVQKFTVILKDLVNGVPTAYDDLTHLLDNSQETLAKSYDHLPSFLKKLITTLPDKLTKNLAPELLAVAAEAQALGGHHAGTEGGAGGFAGAAKSFFKPNSLKDLVTKPGAVVSMLKAIMNALKLRWPAFMGTNVLLSLGLFVLLFVFWYCHKRGREERLKREGATQTVDSEGRIVELNDTPMIDQPGPSRTRTDGSRPHSRRSHTERPESNRSQTDREHRNSHRHSSSRDQTPRSERERDRPGSSRRSSRRPKSREYATTSGEVERDRRS